MQSLRSWNYDQSRDFIFNAVKYGYFTWVLIFYRVALKTYFLHCSGVFTIMLGLCNTETTQEIRFQNRAAKK